MYLYFLIYNILFSSAVKDDPLHRLSKWVQSFFSPDISYSSTQAFGFFSWVRLYFRFVVADLAS